MKHSHKDESEPSAESGNGRDATREPTQPLLNIASLVFAGFLERYQLSILDVALAARLRLLTIWRVLHDEPISAEQAQQIYTGLWQLTGVYYRGRIRLQTLSNEPLQSCGPDTEKQR